MTLRIFTALEDPPVRADGRCVVCLKRRLLLPSPDGANHATDDPFCSSLCARRFHNNPLPESIFTLGRPRKKAA